MSGRIRSVRVAFFSPLPPVRSGIADYTAELLGALSACPGGECGASHSDDVATCHPLKVEIFRPAATSLTGWRSPVRSPFSRTHGA